jgi:chromosome partitioning protein
MQAKIIVVANQKGGAGKTTLSMQLAGSLASKKKVLVVDADPQGTATRWASSADDSTPFPAAVVSLGAGNDKVHRELKKFIKDYDYIIVDCPPAVDSTIPQSALLVADLVLVPIIPSPPDLWAAVGIRKLIENVSEFNKTLQARLVINQSQPNTNLNKEVLQILPEFEMERLKTSIVQRTVYRQSAAYGNTVHDHGTKARQASAEIDALTKEVLNILK